jgi:hypothetical protein
VIPTSADLLREVVLELQRAASAGDLEFPYFYKGKSCGLHGSAIGRMV